MFRILFFILFIFISYLSNAQNNVLLKKLDIEKYIFQLKIGDKSNYIEGNSEIIALINAPISQIHLDLVGIKGKTGMTVEEVKINQDEITFIQLNDQLIINNNENWSAGAKLNIKIKYHGIPGDGLIIGNNKFGKLSFFGDNWPNRARHWLPVIDHPSDKALVEFIIQCPDHYEVIASGENQSSIKIKDGESIHHFKSKVEMPTKVMVFAASDFKKHVYDTIYNTPVTSWIYEENTTGEMDYQSAVDAFQFFSDTIGPYIYEKLANVQSRTRFGGMENAGNIFYFEESVNGKANVEALVAHEVAHQWFGNAATEKDWPHIWLSEGFATYLTDLYFEHKYGKEAFQKRLKKEREVVLNYNKNLSLSLVDTTVTDLMSLLNPNSYQKGAWILHMLRNKVGDDKFYKILQTYYEKYKYSNADSEDFQAVAEDVSGRDLDQFFYQCLYRTGNPSLDIDWFLQADELFIQIEQKQKTEPYELDLELFFGDSGFILPITKRKTHFRIPVDKPVGGPLFDPDIKQLASLTVANKIFKVENPELAIPISPFHTALKEGDLLFQDLDCGPLCDAIESVTNGYKGANFSHVAMVSEINKDTVIIIEAIGGKVRKSTLEQFLGRSYDDHGRPKVMIGRVNNENIKSPAIERMQSYMGKDYDDVFDINNDSYYCSELLYFSFLENGQSIFNLYPMTFKMKDSDSFDPAWVDYYKKLAMDIPEGEPGLNPGGISRSVHVDMIYLFGIPDGYDTSR